MSSNQPTHPKLVISNKSEYTNLAIKLQKAGYRGNISHDGISYSAYEIYHALHEWHQKNKGQEKVAEKMAEAGREFIEEFSKIRKKYKQAQKLKKSNPETKPTTNKPPTPPPSGGSTPTPPERGTPSAQLDRLLRAQRANIKIIEANNQKAALATREVANSLAFVGSKLKPSDLIQLEQLARRYIRVNPRQSPADIIPQLLNSAKQLTKIPIPEKQFQFDRLTNQASQQLTSNPNWQANQDTIQQVLGGGPGFITAYTREDLEHQLADLFHPVLADREDDHKTLSLKSAQEVIEATALAAKVSNPDTDKKTARLGVAQILESQGKIQSAKLIQNLTSTEDLIWLHLNNNYLQTPLANPAAGLSLSDLRGINTIVKLGQANQKPADLIFSELQAQHYQTHPTYHPSPLRRIWDKLFGKNPQPNSLSLAKQLNYQIPPEINRFRLVRFFKNPTASLSGFPSGLRTGLGGLFKDGLSNLKNLFKFGGGGAAKSAALFSNVGRGLTTTIAKVGIPYFSILLTVVGAFVILFIIILLIPVDRGTLDIAAEVRSNYGIGGGQTQSGSQYLSATKTVNHKKLANNTSTDLNYTYSLSPVSNPVLITSISDELAIISESGTLKKDLSGQLPQPPDPTLNTTFTSPSYSFHVTSGIKDVIISNTITINFVTADGTSDNVVAVATTIIGNPTLVGCPQIWPTDSGFHITQGPKSNHPDATHSTIEAIDISSPLNSNVYAVQSGVVKFADWYTSYPVYGKTVIIESNLENGQEYQHWYNHLNAILVSVGDIVAPGQIIAKSGDTANGVAAGTAIHLHFEYRDGNGQAAFPYANCPLPGIDPSTLYGCYGYTACGSQNVP